MSAKDIIMPIIVYKNDKGVLLISENPKYQPMYFTAENFGEE